jgi:hypothetical protein
VARHIFQACSVWIHTQSNITQAIYYSCPDRRVRKYTTNKKNLFGMKNIGKHATSNFTNM